MKIYPLGTNHGGVFMGLMYVPICLKISGYVTDFDYHFSMQWHLFTFYKIKKAYYKTSYKYIRVPEYVCGLFFINFIYKTKESRILAQRGYNCSQDITPYHTALCPENVMTLETIKTGNSILKKRFISYLNSNRYLKEGKMKYTEFIFWASLVLELIDSDISVNFVKSLIIKKIPAIFVFKRDWSFRNV